MRACALPLLTIWECRLATAYHVPPAVVRRWPLALALLRCNYAAQVDGMETWWPDERSTDAEVDARVAAARAGALAVRSTLEAALDT